MKKLLFAILFLFISALSVTAQDMTKQQTLDYILRIYKKVNKFYLSDYSSMLIPVGIDSASLEYDQLIFYYNVPGENYIYSGPRSTTISGELALDEGSDGIKNSDGDWVLRVQSANTAELKRLYYALQHLQDFIEVDPFAGKVDQYDTQKKQKQVEQDQLDQDQQRQYKQMQQRRDEERAEERRREAERRRQAEERERREEERRGQEAICIIPAKVDSKIRSK